MSVTLFVMPTSPNAEAVQDSYSAGAGASACLVYHDYGFTGGVYASQTGSTDQDCHSVYAYFAFGNLNTDSTYVFYAIKTQYHLPGYYGSGACPDQGTCDLWHQHPTGP